MQNVSIDPKIRDFYRLPYYKLSRILLSMIGQWSVQNTKCNLIHKGFIIFGIISSLILMISKLITTPITMDLIANVVPWIFVFITCGTKFCNHIYNKKNMTALLDHMRNDWQQIKLSEEIEIMQKYGENTKRYAKIYILFLYMCLFGYCFLSVSSPILDVIVPLNKSRPRKLMVEVEYFVSTEEYFYPMFCHMCFVGTLGITTMLAIDVIFITYIQHACGLFAIASIRLEYILYNKELMVHDDKNWSNTNNFFLRRIEYCIEIHQKATKFAELIETSFTWSCLIQMLLNIVSISITLVKLLISLDEFGEMLQSVILVCGQLLHVFIYSLPGQRLIDHSNYVTVAAYNGKWYDMPVKLQKLILLVIRRGMEPSFVTAGHMCVLSLTSFSMVLQSCMSYFTVLCSL